MVQSLPMACELPAGRCTGHCCEEFQLPWDPEGIRNSFDTQIPGTDGWMEWQQLSDMLIYLGPVENPPLPKDRGGTYLWNYTCRHFDTEKRLCTIYENRPLMCRNHGVEYSCVTQGCSMTNAMRDPLHLDPTKYPEPSDAALE